MNDQLLLDVSVDLEDPDGDWQSAKTIQIDKLPYGEVHSAYSLLGFPDSGDISGSLGATLKFKVMDVDPSTGEPDSEDTYDQNYVLEEVDINVSDSVQGVAKSAFGSAWEALGDDATREETFQLSTVENLPDAVKKVNIFPKLLYLNPLTFRLPISLDWCPANDQIVFRMAKRNTLYSSPACSAADSMFSPKPPSPSIRATTRSI